MMIFSLIPSFDPISCAVFTSALEKTLCACCRSPPRRFIPSARIWLRRIPDEVVSDVMLNEAVEPLLDYVVNIIDIHSLFVAVILLVAFAMRRKV